MIEGGGKELEEVYVGLIGDLKRRLEDLGFENEDNITWLIVLFIEAFAKKDGELGWGGDE